MEFLRLDSSFIRRFLFLLPILLCVAFAVAYSILSVVRHQHFQSFGYDLGINDQTVWRYSKFELPITTIDPFPDKTKLSEHVEFVYALISPFYWIWSSRRMLLILEVIFICSGGLAIFLLARKRHISYSVSMALLISYLTFFGVQNAVWFDVHSLTFGAAFLAWFLYALDQKKKWPTILFFFLAITAKENIAFIAFFVALIYFTARKDKMNIFLMAVSLVYLLFIFFIFFPQIMHTQYLYQNHAGLLSDLNPLHMFDTSEKLQTEFYTILSFGFLPFLAPLSLLPGLADLATYFVIGSDLGGAQGLFMHYRVTLAPLLAWAAITTIIRYKFLDNKYIAIYMVVVAAFAQYTLHLPLSYLTKSWFWQTPSSVEDITKIIRDDLPNDASVVAQNNIVPHLSHRDQIYSLYPRKKHFSHNSPCGTLDCNWFSWYDHPKYLFVDTASDWDIRHLLANRPDFIAGLQNIEKAGVVKVYKKVGTATLYTVLKNPDDIK
ncbi:hypothetical protein BH09PAT2_BH09PAT2_10340 [soil metagenome]